MSTCQYNFNVPCIAVWISHITIGLFLVYVGYLLFLKSKNETLSLPYGVSSADLKNISVKIPDFVPITLIVLGVLAALYHAHIWYTKRNGPN